MTLFDTYGHLTEEALSAWAEGALCEEQRLSVAEHLAVCDACLLRMANLEDGGLPTELPEKDLVTPALQTVRKRRAPEVFKRCGIAAAAACFAFLTWRFDVFAPPESELKPQPTRPNSAQVLAAQLSDGLFAWGTDLSDTLQSTFAKDDHNEMTQRSGDHV